MKNTLHLQRSQFSPLMEAGKRSKVRPAASTILALLGAALLIASPARANLLYNGDFNDPASGAAPTGWSSWSWDTGYANHENNPSVSYDGSYYLVAGNGWYDGGGGFYQTLAATAGTQYTLTVLSGADAYWLPTGRMTLFFLDSSGVQLSQAERNTVDPAVYGDNYDIPHPWASYSLAAIAPPNTTQVKVEFASNNPGGVGGSIWFENADLESSVVYPAIANVQPDGTILMQVTNTLSFTATAGVAITSVQVVLNGTDISSSLAITGSSTSKSVSYSGLKTNQAYTGTITVKDANNLSASVPLNFDTFNPVFLWEAEDWDYDNGQYINNPVPTSTVAANSYFGLNGAQGVDENETGTDPANLYRSGDAMNAGLCADLPRQKYLDAKALDPSVQDWQVGYFDAGEWVNYTRNFPSGTYNIYARLANGNGGTAAVYLDQVTSGRGTTSQGTLSLGSFQFPAQGWTAFSYVPLRDRFGNVAEVALSGVTTLRATGGGANMNFFMLATPRNDLPRISNVYPDGTLELQATNVFKFTASNPTVPIYSTNITLTLNNVDVTSQLTLGGSPSSWDVSLPLALNAARYTAVITVQDANANVTSTTIYFDTFNPTNFTWEAEDYDFSGGLFIDNPVPTSSAGANSYFGLDSTYGVDYSYDVSDPATPYTNYWRTSLGIDVCGDYPPLAKYVTARLTDPSIRDFNLAYWTTNSWANYTRTYPAGTYNVYARMASGMGGSVQLDKITSGVATHLGQFNLSNWGWGVYSWWPLVDANGQLVTVSLGGVSTLRATTDGSANANRFMLVTPLAAVTPPQITPTVTGGSVVLSFPTQSGHLYQVWGKNNLTDANWTPLASVSGDGSVKSWSELATAAHRFYRLIIQ